MNGSEYIAKQLLKDGRITEAQAKKMMESKASVSTAGVLEDKWLANVKRKFNMPKGLVLSDGTTSDDLQKLHDGREVDQCLQNGAYVPRKNNIYKHETTYNCAIGSDTNRAYGIIVNFN